MVSPSITHFTRIHCCADAVAPAIKRIDTRIRIKCRWYFFKIQCSVFSVQSSAVLKPVFSSPKTSLRSSSFARSHSRPSSQRSGRPSSVVCRLNSTPVHSVLQHFHPIFSANLHHLKEQIQGIFARFHHLPCTSRSSPQVHILL